jgi:hypothetical protein
MGSVVDYVRATFDSFARRPFGIADSIAFSQLAYLAMPSFVPRLKISRPRDVAPVASPIESVPLHNLLRAETYDEMVNGMAYPEDTVDLIRAMGESPRFRNVRIGGYVERRDHRDHKQFCAMTFDLGNGVLYVAFRGTDGSVLGWREDFDMAFLSPVPSQRSAARYVRAIAAQWQGGLILGGHSKGGNLAVYAAARSKPEIQERILGVYSHDGPGFSREFLASEGFGRIESKIEKTVPEASVIGMLFSSGKEYTIVRSNAAGIMQHFLTTWRFEQGELVTSKRLSSLSQYLSRTVNTWLQSYEPDERRRFIDDLFAVIGASGYSDFSAILGHWTSTLPAMMAAARGLDPVEREHTSAILRGLAGIAVKTISPVRRK